MALLRAQTELREKNESCLDERQELTRVVRGEINLIVSEVVLVREKATPTIGSEEEAFNYLSNHLLKAAEASANEKISSLIEAKSVSSNPENTVLEGFGDFIKGFDRNKVGLGFLQKNISINTLKRSLEELEANNPRISSRLRLNFPEVSAIDKFLIDTVLRAEINSSNLVSAFKSMGQIATHLLRHETLSADQKKLALLVAFVSLEHSRKTPAALEKILEQHRERYFK